jgi:hypothetical protein
MQQFQCRKYRSTRIPAQHSANNNIQKATSRPLRDLSYSARAVRAGFRAKAAMPAPVAQASLIFSAPDRQFTWEGILYVAVPMQSASSLYSTRLCASLLLPIPPSTKFETMLPHSLSLFLSFNSTLPASALLDSSLNQIWNFAPSLSFSHAFSFSLPLSLYISLLYPTLLNWGTSTSLLKEHASWTGDFWVTYISASGTGQLDLKLLRYFATSLHFRTGPTGLKSSELLRNFSTL